MLDLVLGFVVHGRHRAGSGRRRGRRVDQNSAWHRGV